jgi:acetyltransferase-like isoleucine patch superfamily enzyme
MVVSLVIVESMICALSSAPAIALWLWILRLTTRSMLLRTILLSVAFVPSYILFALLLMLTSPLVVRAMGWHVPENASMQIARYEWPLLRWVRYDASIHLVRVLAGLLFRGSPLWTAHLRLYGARMGKRVYVNSLHLTDYNLLEFGDDVVIGDDVHLSGHTVEEGVVRTAPLRIGPGSTLGVGSVLEIGVVIGARCQLGAMTFVPKYARLNDATVYVGIPARALVKAAA